jgi:hypothetical protein
VRDRAWLSPAAWLAWVTAVAALFFGGAFAWIVLAAFCEDVGGAGSDRFCRHGGWETSGLVFATLFVAGLVVPTVGVVSRRKRLFWAGIVGPILLALLNFVLWSTFGRA